MAASEQGFLPRAFSNFHKSRKTPINGILLSSTLSTIFICLGDFSSLTLFYGVRRASVFRLETALIWAVPIGRGVDLELLRRDRAARFTENGADSQAVRLVPLHVLALQPADLDHPHRPYRTFLVTPILFASTALFLIVLSCFSRPIQSFAAFAFCVAGVVPYYLHVRRSGAFQDDFERGAMIDDAFVAEPRASDGLEMT